MTKRHSHEREQVREHLEATYIVRKKVTLQDLCVTNRSDLFKVKKPDRHYNNCVYNARMNLKFEDWALIHLKPHYRLKILESQELKNFIGSLFDISISKFSRYSEQELERINAFALQMMNFSLVLLSRTMPPEFARSFNHFANPLNDFIEAIYENSRKNKKDIPRFNKLELPIA